MNALTKLEPIPLPDPRRPTRMPSLPGWLTSQKNAVCLNLQIVEGKFQDVMTLPTSLMPTAEQKNAIRAYQASLSSLQAQTAERGADAEKAILIAVTNLLLVLPGRKSGEHGAEATGEAYLAALDDVPYWAVEAAIRRWYRGECGNDERGEPYNCHWAPDPAALRRLSNAEAWRVASRIKELEPVLEAVPFIDSSEDLKRGRAALLGMRTVMGDTDKLKDLTFDQAVEIGSQEKIQARA